MFVCVCVCVFVCAGVWVDVKYMSLGVRWLGGDVSLGARVCVEDDGSVCVSFSVSVTVCVWACVCRSSCVCVCVPGWGVRVWTSAGGWEGREGAQV